MVGISSSVCVGGEGQNVLEADRETERQTDKVRDTEAESLRAFVCMCLCHGA